MLLIKQTLLFQHHSPTLPYSQLLLEAETTGTGNRTLLQMARHRCNIQENIQINNKMAILFNCTEKLK